MTGRTDSVVVERELSHPPEKVWRALTQPHLIREWLMKSDDFRPELGHRFRFEPHWGGSLECEVLAIDPHRTLSYAWNLVHDDPSCALRSVVTFTLTPIDRGTRLRLEQVGFRAEQAQAFVGARVGWPRFLRALEEVLARVG